MSDFPTLYNANLNLINNNKIEMSTTTLPAVTTMTGLTTVGTIGTGVWQGTAIGVAYNGTGTTSPTSKQLMVGNGASGFQVVGFGSSGQFLTSGGADTLPSWTTSALDTALDYSFTGSYFGVDNLFASTTALINATSTNRINGATYFGGDGSDGALDTSGGAVDIDLTNGTSTIKNYTSINVASNNLTFSNAPTNGAIVTLKSQGNCTISSTIDGTGDGASAGTGGITSLIGLTNLGGNGETNTGSGSGGAGGAITYYINSLAGKSIKVSSGAGGGGGGSGYAGAGGAGGAGGLAIILECRGSLNFSGTIDVSGAAGATGSTSGGGGGGGGGGTIVVIYELLTANTGTLTVTGGAGGVAPTDGEGTNNVGTGGGGGGSVYAGSVGLDGSRAAGDGGNGGAGGLGQSLIIRNTEW